LFRFHPLPIEQLRRNGSSISKLRGKTAIQRLTGRQRGLLVTSRALACNLLVFMTGKVRALCKSLQLLAEHESAAGKSPCNNNKKGASMFKQKKFKQATLILIAITIILILPNLNRLVG